MGSTSDIVDSVRGLYQDTKYADLEIKCGGKSFKVHRAIVCPRSKVLDKECSGGFLESDTRAIEHKVFDADTMDRMLQFIYRGEYSTKSNWSEMLMGTRVQPFEPTMEPILLTSSSETCMFQSITAMPIYRFKSFEELRLEEHDLDLSPLTEGLEQHVQTYFIADYYELPALKDLALSGFRRQKRSLLTHDDKPLISMIKTIYGNTPTSDRLLRPEIFNFCIAQRKKLLVNDRFAKALVEQPELQDFAADFTVGLYNHYEKHIEASEKFNRKIVADLQADLLQQATVASANEAQKNSISSILSKIQAQIAELDTFVFCRSCHQPWSYCLERHGPYGYLAKCNNCEAKHYSSHGAV